MADNLDNIIGKLKREEDYTQDRLKLIFGVSFRKPDEAYEKHQRFERKRGYGRAAKRMQEAPRKFGRLKGRLVFGFWKDETRCNAELSLKELQHYAKKLHLTRLQIKEAVDKQNREKLTKEQQSRKQESAEIRTKTSDEQQETQTHARRP